MMTEHEPKTKIVENAKNTEEKQDKARRRFFSGLKNRFLALATAGFITLGAGWTRELSQQLEIEDKKETITEFILENEVTETALGDFKNKIEKEEPKFAKLMEEYKQVVETSLDKMEKEILDYNITGSIHYKNDQRLISEQQDQISMGNYDDVDISWVIEKDHNLITFLRSNPNLLRDGHKFLKENLDHIFWSMAFLNNSKDSRNALTDFVRPPNIVFESHDSQDRRAITDASLLSGQWYPQVTFYPVALMNSDRQFDINTYINTYVHELGHVVLVGSGNGQKVKRKIGDTDFVAVLDEGRTQSLTYKVIRYINEDVPNIKPISGEAGHYDQNLIIAEIIESITRTHSNSDFMVEWQMGIIDDQTMLNNLRTSLNNLGLNEDIYKLLTDFGSGSDRIKSSTKLLSDLLTELRLGGVNLSDDFVRSILRR